MIVLGVLDRLRNAWWEWRHLRPEETLAVVPGARVAVLREAGRARSCERIHAQWRDVSRFLRDWNLDREVTVYVDGERALP